MLAAVAAAAVTVAKEVLPIKELLVRQLRAEAAMSAQAIARAQALAHDEYHQRCNSLGATVRFHGTGAEEQASCGGHQRSLESF